IEFGSVVLATQNIEMHLHTITAIYFTLLFAQGQAKEQECRSNVTAILLEVLNEKCSNITEAYQLPTTYKPLKDENYDCTLQREAKVGRPSDPNALFFFDGRSKFDEDWKSSLIGAVNNADVKDPDTSCFYAATTGSLSCALNARIRIL
uniref:Transferrin-like domain-containing protein n=1 Tax=Haemonchus contortus TaxID=6289 RepID=A0A7I4YTL2_HAECO